MSRGGRVWGVGLYFIYLPTSSTTGQREDFTGGTPDAICASPFDSLLFEDQIQLSFT